MRDLSPLASMLEMPPSMSGIGALVGVPDLVACVSIVACATRGSGLMSLVVCDVEGNLQADGLPVLLALGPWDEATRTWKLISHDANACWGCRSGQLKVPMETCVKLTARLSVRLRH